MSSHQKKITFTDNILFTQGQDKYILSFITHTYNLLLGSLYTRQYRRQQSSIDPQGQHGSSDIEHEPYYDNNCKNFLTNPFKL